MFLHLAGPPRTMSGLPSWVIYFTETGLLIPMCSFENMDWIASGVASRFRVWGHPTIRDSIVLSGFVVDSVNFVSRLEPVVTGLTFGWSRIKQKASDTMKWIEEWTRVTQSLEPYPTAEAWHEVRWRTLVCNSGSTMEKANLKDFNNFQYFMATMKLTASSDTAEEFEKQGTLRMVEGSWVFDTAIGHTRRRCLFTTTNGYAGKGSYNNLCSGDKIVILMGATSPFIIRPNTRTDTKELTYTLISDCYIHGLMYGEGLKLGVAEDIMLC
jgi:hypothetical protein